MADINGRTLISSGSPDVEYYITYTKKRINNSNMQYIFTIKTSLGSSQSYLATGHNLQCTITVNGGKGSATLKDRSSVWSGVGPHSTKTITVNCTSTTGNSAQTVSFSVVNDWGNAGDYSSSSYTVTSSPLTSTTPIYSSCIAPTNVRIDSSNGFYLPPAPDDFATTSSSLPSITLQWDSGAGGTNNTLQKYYIQQTIVTKDKLPHANYDPNRGQVQLSNGYWSYPVRVSSINGQNNENSYNPSSNLTSVTVGLIYEGVGGIYPIPREAEISYRIRSEGSAGSDYYSNYAYSSSFIKINSLPIITVPSLDKKYIPNSGGIVNFSWAASDSDNQKLTYDCTLYKKEYSGEISVIIEETKDSASFSYAFPKEEGSIEGYYLKIIVSDGVEKVSTQSAVILYNIPPTISINSASPSSGGRTKKIILSYLGDAGEDEQSLKYDINIIYSNNKEDLVFDGRGIQIDTSLTTSTITDDLLKSAGVPEASYLKCRVRCNDEYDYSDWAEFSQIFQINKKPAAPTSLTAVSSDNRESYGESSINLSIFESSIDLTWNLNTTGNLEGQTIQQIILERATNSNSSNFQGWIQILIAAANTSPTSFTDTSSILSNLIRGYYVSYRVKYIDDLGDSSDYFTLSTPLKKNTSPAIVGDIYPSSNIYYPYRTNELNIQWTSLQNSSDDDINNVPHRFKIYLTIPGFSEVEIKNGSKDYYYNLGENKTIELIGDVNSLDIPFVQNDTLKDFVKNALNNNPNNYNADYVNVQIRLIAFDSFGISSNSITGNFDLYLRENPEFIEGTYTIEESEPSQGQDYYLGISGYYDLYYKKKSEIDWKIISDPNYNIENKYKMVDSGEIIKFRWQKAKDKNGASDISTYTIKMYYSEDVGKLEDDISEDQYITLVNLNRATLDQGHDSVDYYEYEHKVSTVDINRVVKFLITCTDSTGLQSQSIRFPFGIEICRLRNPSITFNSVEFINDTSGISLEVDYNIPDYGGSQLSPKRGIYYSSRRNLEEDNSNPKIIITLEYSQQPNFPGGNDSSDNPLTQSIEIYNLEDSTDKTYPWNDSYNVAKTNTSQTITGDEVPDDNFNYFTRLKIIVSNKNGDREYYSSTIPLRGLAAPFSFRKIGIGINNNNPEGRLHITARSNDEQIERIIFGDADSLNSQRFVIDLITGKLIAGVLDVGDL